MPSLSCCPHKVLPCSAPPALVPVVSMSVSELKAFPASQEGTGVTGWSISCNSYSFQPLESQSTADVEPMASSLTLHQDFLITWTTKDVLLGSTISQCLSVSHIHSVFCFWTSSFNQKNENQVQGIEWGRDAIYNLCLSLLPLPQVCPSSSCFQIYISETGKCYVYTHVHKKWVDRHLYNFRWLRLGSGVTGLELNHSFHQTSAS